MNKAVGQIPTRPVNTCPVCTSPSSTLLRAALQDRHHGIPGRWRFRRCSACRTVYLDPQPQHAGDAYPPSYGQHRLPQVSGMEASRFPRRLRTRLRADVLESYGYKSPDPATTPSLLRRWLSRLPAVRLGAIYGFVLLPPAHLGRRLLDVGCGNGRFIRFARTLGWQVEGVEPDPISAAHAHSLTAAPIHASIEASELLKATYDVITLNHVLEHSAAPVDLLHRCYMLLRPGGRIGVCVPNWDGLTHRLFGDYWIGLEPSRHLVMFDASSLQCVIEQAGFEVDTLETLSRGGGRSEFARSWTLRFGSLPSRILLEFWRALTVLLRPMNHRIGDEIVVWAHRPAQDKAVPGTCQDQS
jgi:2-polyprenyl-3-methyl-5-hydroxy-6-metoxy-1,4-benzoquinol methylase